MTESIANRRLVLADSKLDWEEKQWECVLNTDSSPFYLKFASNRQNDRIWCAKGTQPPALPLDKHSLKTECYLGVSALGVTRAVFVDSPETVKTENYCSLILPHFLQDVSARGLVATDDPTTTRLFLYPDQMISRQDLAPPHTSKKTQAWIAKNFKHSWDKTVCPPRFTE